MSVLVVDDGFVCWKVRRKRPSKTWSGIDLCWQEPQNNWLRKSHFGIPDSVFQMKPSVTTCEKLTKMPTDWKDISISSYSKPPLLTLDQVVQLTIGHVRLIRKSWS
jgi:hypothetical protein